jgi:hypothetical protein
MAYRFELVTEPETFENAQENCVLKGGDLAKLDTERKRILVENIVRQQVSYWVGLSPQNQGKKRWSLINW